MNDNSKRNVSPVYFCYSPKQHAFLKRNGLRSVGTGNNVNNGRQFWQYERGEELDDLLNQWSSNRPNK